MKHLINLFYAGLELTLACPCRCETCGSNAQKPRPNELDTPAWLNVIGQLAGLGCKRISLLGGEPLLHPDWSLLAERSIELGMDVELITSGIGVDEAGAALMKEIGLASVTVSVDGTREVHNAQRKVRDGFERAIGAIGLLDRAGLRVGVTTQINQKSLTTLDSLAPKLEAAGALGWQVQLTMPQGRAEGRSDLAVSPELMPKIHNTLKRLKKRNGLRPHITDNIGYLTPDDPLLRTPSRMPDRCWLGCFAGLRGIGIMSNGSIKGCLALPDSMIEGSILKESLAHIWKDTKRFAYNRAFDPANLSGECASCKYGAICRGGCTAVAMTVHKKPNISTHCLRLNRATR